MGHRGRREEIGGGEVVSAEGRERRMEDGAAGAGNSKGAMIGGPSRLVIVNVERLRSGEESVPLSWHAWLSARDHGVL